MPDIDTVISELINQQQLPAQYRTLVTEYILPLSAQLARRQQQRPLVIGVNGGQGSGKSTLCLFLNAILEQQYQKNTVVLSLDDFYLARADRQWLAENVHPLLKTRGVPGTHDIPLAQHTFSQLLAGKPVSLPAFNKASDDPVPEQQWHYQQQPADIILLEGWCVGAIPQPQSALSNPINDLEENEDADGRWRSYINNCLDHGYRQWFSSLDYLVMLSVPDMVAVKQWRQLQEEKLLASEGPSKGVMTAEQIQRFIQHFQRLTEYQLQEMPARADVVFYLNQQHGIDYATGLDKNHD
ncbi:hypothetical protein [Oceanicoccus sagamiensis]|uniref:Phosphoribulokinase/uridine kinase domain-containing protein n=1 Tax=Oceanicoccus sagamiensis TaxID=716816 RepID=A0A1X9NFN0_9GAMM|nr:hypothetical protein [Oceanicoccus sagamiensis]ARN73757.1 hypothetical protein BST96_06280 [Oceanicoccus sagamiensis]